METRFVPRLRHRIAIEQPNDSQQSTSGEVQEAWTVLKYSWAMIEPLSGRQMALAQIPTVNGVTVHKVTIRYTPDLKITHRIKYGSRILNINSIRDIEERRRWMELTCTESLK